MVAVFLESFLLVTFFFKEIMRYFFEVEILCNMPEKFQQLEKIHMKFFNALNFAESKPH